MSNSQGKVSVGGLAVAAIAVVIGLRVVAAVIKPSVKVADLKAFSDTEGAFTARLPGTPKQTSRPTSIPGVSFQLHASEVGDTAFVVGYYDIPDDLTLEGKEQEALSLEIQSFSKGLKGTPIGAPRKFELQDEAAQEARFKIPGKGELLMRVVLRADSRIYHVLYMSKSYDEQVAKAFVESFEMTGEL